MRRLAARPAPSRSSAPPPSSRRAGAGPGTACPSSRPRRRRPAGGRRRRPPRRSTRSAAGETLSELFARHGVDGPRPRRPRARRSRSTRAGCAPAWSSASASSRPGLAAQPHQRPHQPRSSGSSSSAIAERVGRRGRADRVARRGRSGSKARSTTRCTRRSTRRCRDDQLDGADRQRLAWDLADVYAWQVDFTRDIQPGDRFQVVFERLVSEDGEVRFGRVLASDLTMSGKSLTAFRFDERRPARPSTTPRATRSAGRSSAPRCSSAGSPPPSPARGSIRCSGITRRHEGTDYAAAPGTPVMAAGDGVVLRAGRAGGYGNLIELRHRNGITTRYGHLRGFAPRHPRRRAGRAGTDDRLRRARPASPPARTCTTSSGSTASPRTRGGSSSATARRSATRIRAAFEQRARPAAAPAASAAPERRRRAIAQQPAETHARWLP